MMLDFHKLFDNYPKTREKGDAKMCWSSLDKTHKPIKI